MFAARENLHAIIVCFILERVAYLSSWCVTGVDRHSRGRPCSAASASPHWPCIHGPPITYGIRRPAQGDHDKATGIDMDEDFFDDRTPRVSESDYDVLVP